MFVAIYSFKVRSNQEKQFISAWTELTKLIYQYENSLGSRLHKKTETEYIAYAQWPDKETWQNSGQNLPHSANECRTQMKAACEQITTEHELEVIDDLLQTNTYS